MSVLIRSVTRCASESEQAVSTAPISFVDLPDKLNDRLHIDVEAADDLDRIAAMDISVFHVQAFTSGVVCRSPPKLSLTTWSSDLLCRSLTDVAAAWLDWRVPSTILGDPLPPRVLPWLLSIGEPPFDPRFNDVTRNGVLLPRTGDCLFPGTERFVRIRLDTGNEGFGMNPLMQDFGDDLKIWPRAKGVGRIFRPVFSLQDFRILLTDAESEDVAHVAEDRSVNARVDLSEILGCDD
ncbi:MAG: hypothetical protein H7144_14590 [Burkholderiales bacterium]|nr:hypothetical protein [Phycisphaerae bacterium]